MTRIATTTVIRSFRIAHAEFQHVLDLDDDSVYLVQLNEDGEQEHLLKFDASCGIWQPTDDGVKRIGNFSLEGGTWVAYEGPLRTRIELGANVGVEALLDAEVVFSKRWLGQQGKV